MTADELIAKITGDPSDPFEYEDIVKAMIIFARHHVKKALETALDEVPYGGSDEVRYEDVVGILTCYPPIKIK